MSTTKDEGWLHRTSRTNHPTGISNAFLVLGASLKAKENEDLPYIVPEAPLGEFRRGKIAVLVGMWENRWWIKRIVWFLERPSEGHLRFLPWVFSELGGQHVWRGKWVGDGSQLDGTQRRLKDATCSITSMIDIKGE